jgi:hypothetical protein
MGMQTPVLLDPQEPSPATDTPDAPNMIALDIPNLQHRIEPRYKVEHPRDLIPRCGFPRYYTRQPARCTRPMAEKTLTVGKILQQRLDPLVDDIRREHHPANRVQKPQVDLTAYELARRQF